MAGTKHETVYKKRGFKFIDEFYVDLDYDRKGRLIITREHAAWDPDAAAASPITGSIDVQADPPAEAQRANWLPAPKGSDFSLFLRAYWPKTPIIDGSWTPPAAMNAN
jgi:hypothetical protein